ncbi:HAD-IA family hydrolase [Pelagicoccus sp. SDUM812003]|nr:HAD-IA family hydrolase [Pelagicoccus sp. SDUM812003]
MVSKDHIQAQPQPSCCSPKTPLEYEAVIFDMDGVVTRTASAHANAWKRTFDEFLRARSEATGEAHRPFEHPQDYLAHVDGRPRYQGVDAFLKSRGIELPFGKSADAPGFETVCAVGNRKNEVFNEVIALDGVGLYDSTLSLIHQLRQQGVRIGLATSSRNADLILSKSGVEELFETVVDGIVSAKLGLKGKPEPDIFTTAAFCLGIDPSRAIVVEDAVSGVQAGSRGGFALTLGLAREDNEAELREGGANVVVNDLACLSPETLNDYVIERKPHV